MTEDTNKIIQSLWVGPKLSTMEQLCIRSFLRHGHDFHLYTYDDMEGIPAGTTVKDGNEILPKSQISVYTHIADFADLFRLKLLALKGGWYIDMDAVCLRRFDFPEDYVFGYTQDGVTNYVMKAPANSDVMNWCVDQALRVARPRMAWGEAGGSLLALGIEYFALQKYILPEQVFCFMPWYTLPGAAIGEPSLDFPVCAYVAHLCHEMWVKLGYDRDRQYPSGSLYEKLKKENNR
jgi:Glycosyltransferase sugar-binding region containing DXD motif